MGIKKFFKKAGRFFKRIAVGLFGKSALKKLAAAAKAMLKTAVGRIAVKVVFELEGGHLTDIQKAKEALKRIRQAAKDARIETKDSLINLLIEFAVARLKGVVPQR